MRTFETLGFLPSNLLPGVKLPGQIPSLAKLQSAATAMNTPPGAVGPTAAYASSALAVESSAPASPTIFGMPRNTVLIGGVGVAALAGAAFWYFRR